MSAGSLAADITVPFFAAMMCVTPAISRPTVPFGIRVPYDRVGAPVIRQQRRAYLRRTAAIGACCTLIAVLGAGHGSWWLARIILLAELGADFGCFWLARRKIAAAKRAEDWFAGHRQVVATDTSWRADPPRFPVLWLVPALAVIAATILTGAVRYPVLPAHLGAHHALKSVPVAFAVVIGQLYVTALWTGLMLIVYRSRPDIEATDAAASTRRYRRYLAACTRAVFTLLALVDLSLLLFALRTWQVAPALPAALAVLPFAIGLLVLAVVMIRTGQAGSRLPGAGRRPSGSTTARDDDRFWKAGLIYFNRDDPAIMVGARFGVGWTFNVANPMAWLILAGLVAVPAGLVTLAVTAGL